MSQLSRRELLAMFLGAPLAAGCSKQKPTLPPGELVGASDTLGHRLRDGFRPTVDMRGARRTSVVIVGGGVAGLAAARRLLQAEIDDFVLVELESKPGGTSRAGTSKVVSYPWGAHYLPAPTGDNRALVDLLDEMDIFEGRDAYGDPIVAEQYLCRYPQERLFFKGQWQEGLYLHTGASRDDQEQLDRFQREIEKWVAWRDGSGRRAFTVPMASGSDDPEVRQLDNLSMEDWLDQNDFTSPRLRWFVDYACRDDYGAHSRQTSAWAGLFYFAARVPRPGSPSRPFITWPEGNGKLVEYLCRPLKDKLLLDYSVCDLVPRERDGQEEILVTAFHRDSVPIAFQAQQVIFAAPHFLTRFLIRDYRESPPDHVADFEYGAWSVANLTLTDRPFSRGFPLAWDNVLYESPSLGYVTATHQRGLDYGPTVLTYYYPLCDEDVRRARQRLLETDRDGWTDIALTDLERAHQGLRSQTERVDVMRWGHAMVRPRPNFVWGSARLKAGQPYRGIHFAHSDLSGIALFEEAFYRGTLAAEQVINRLGVTSNSVL